MDLEEIVCEIFLKPSRPPCSIQLDFSECQNYETVEGGEFLFKQLLMVFTQGMKILYGDENGSVDLSKIGPEDFHKVNDYFKSFGFEVQYKITSLDEESPVDLSDKKGIEDYFLNLKTKQCRYTISFKPYISETSCKEGSI